MLRAVLKRIRPGAAPTSGIVQQQEQEGSMVVAAYRRRCREQQQPQRPLSTETATATATASDGAPTPPASSSSSSQSPSSPAAPRPGLDALNRAYATGRRKTSVARVWLQEGDGRIVVNDRELHEAFGRVAYRDKLVEPFAVTGTAGRFDVKCTVKGGGTTGQVGAIALGISRALEVWDPAHRPALAKESLFTRDDRKVERKKPGQPKARKKDQWVKR